MRDVKARIQKDYLRRLFFLTDEITGHYYCIYPNNGSSDAGWKWTLGDNPCQYIAVKQAISLKLKGLEEPTCILSIYGTQRTIIT